MPEEIIADNKAPVVETDNKVETKEANLPNLKDETVEKPKAPQDPEYDKWATETGSLQNAYHRLKGSAAEVEKWRKEAEEAKDFKVKYDQISTELQTLAAKDPELVERIQKSLSGEATEADNKELRAELPPEDRKLLDNLRAKETYDAMQTIKSFRENFKDYIQTEAQWDAVREHAKRLDGMKDINGNPYTLKTALQVALRAERPEVISDRSSMETYASTANRDSAAEAGDTGYGRASDINLDPQEEEMIKRFSQFGVTREGYLRRKAQNS
jgi:hypothetical protein